MSFPLLLALIAFSCTMRNPDYITRFGESDSMDMNNRDGLLDQQLNEDTMIDMSGILGGNINIDMNTDMLARDDMSGGGVGGSINDMGGNINDMGGMLGGMLGDMAGMGGGMLGGNIGDMGEGGNNISDMMFAGNMVDHAIPCQLNTSNDCDGDGLSLDQGDCRDDDANIFAGAIESCDGVDNNCDGIIDGNVTECYSGPVGTQAFGICKAGLATCIAAVTGPCMGEILPTVESCGDGLDNDCNGIIDNGCDQDMDGFTVDGRDCDDQNAMINPDMVELCNGLDDNCNGQVDDLNESCYSGPANTQNIGICRGGSLACNNNMSICGGEILPLAIDICGNQQDDNCNGQVDENCNGNTCGNLDLNSALDLSSHCLTITASGTSLIKMTPRTINQSSLPADLTLSLNTQPALTVQESGRIGDTWYWLVSTPAVADSYRVSINASCGGNTISFTQIDHIDVLTPLADGTSTAGGGCSPIDDNLIVIVKDATTNLPISNAYVMVGNQPANNLQITTVEAVRGNAGNSPNFKRTNASGGTRFKDLSNQLNGPQVLTVGADNYEYVTLQDINASFVRVMLRPITRPAIPGLKLSGILSDFNNLSRDGMTDAGLVLPSLTLEDLFSFKLSKLFSRFDCWNVNNLNIIPPTEIPGNMYVPAQPDFVNLNEHAFVISDLSKTTDHFVALGGKFSTNNAINLVSAGNSLGDILSIMTFNEIGVLQNQATVANNIAQSVNMPLNRDLNRNVSCALSNVPSNSSATCLVIGAWPAALSGRLFLQGLASATVAQLQQGPVSLNNLTTVSPDGPFAGIGYMSAAVALFDNSNAALASAASIAVDKTTVTNNGGNIRFNRFFDAMIPSRNNNTFNWNTPVKPNSPVPETCSLELYQEFYTSYDPGRCTPNNRLFVQEAPLWTIYLPGDLTSYSLPTLSNTSPRFATNGLVPAVNNSSIKMRIKCQNYGGDTTFEFNSFDMNQLQQNMLFQSLNSAAY